MRGFTLGFDRLKTTPERSVLAAACTAIVIYCFLFVCFISTNMYMNNSIQERGVEANGEAHWYYSQSRRQALFFSKQLKVQKKHIYNKLSRCCLKACLKPFSTPIMRIQSGNHSTKKYTGNSLCDVLQL